MMHRSVCEVLYEMRACLKSLNFGCLQGQIEEVQILANRMESALTEKRSLEEWHNKAKEEKADYERLLKVTNKLRVKAGEKTKKVGKVW
jgi:hypothetical protein